MNRSLKNISSANRGRESLNGETVESLKPAPTPAAKAQANSSRWSIVLLLMALCFISHFNRISMSVAGTERIIPGYGIKPERMGWVYTTFLITYTALMFAGGTYIDRVGTRRALATMAVGSGFFAIVTGLVGIVASAPAALFVSLLIVRGLMGVVTTPLHPGSAQAVSNWLPEQERSLANGLVTGAALFGVAFAPLLFGHLMEWVRGWSSAFMIAGIVTIGWGVIWWFAARGEPRYKSAAAFQNERESLGAQWKLLLRNRSLIWLTLSYGAVGYFQYLFFYWLEHYFASVLHVPQEKSRLFTTIPNLAMAICMPFGGWLSDRMQRRYGRGFGRKIAPMAGMVLSAVFVEFGLMCHLPEAMVFWFALAMGAVGLAESAFWLTAVELGGRRGGSAAAVINTGGNGLGLLAPLFTPVVGEWLGWTWSIALGGLIAVLGGVCWWFIRLDDTNLNAATKNA